MDEPHLIPQPLDYVTPVPRGKEVGDVERIGYFLVRFALAACGLFTLVLLFGTPVWHRDLESLGLFGFVFLLTPPNRWTQKPVLLGPRLLLHLLAGTFLGMATYRFVRQSGMDEPLPWIWALIGIALPICLLWSRRIHRTV